MWQSRYKQLVKRMYALRRLCRRLEILAISTLHPRHPLQAEHLRLVEAWEEEKAQIPSWAFFIRRGTWCFLFACRDSLVLLWLRFLFRKRLRQLRAETFQLVLKTWRFSSEPSQGVADFYYGTLPQQLQTRGIRCLFLCGKARGSQLERAFNQSVLRKEETPAIPELLLVPAWAPAVAFLKQISIGLFLRGLAKRMKGRHLKLVCAQAARSSLHPIVQRNLFYFYIARATVRIWRPKAFCALYEGHPWETLAWHGVKAADPKCLTVGYQHTVILPHSRELLSPNRNSWEFSVPDVTLCLGEVTRRMMEDGHPSRGSRFVTFGTFRGFQARTDNGGPHPGRRTVLVLPEGLLNEARLLFDCALGLAARMPEIRFIFRCHPERPFHEVRPHLAVDPEHVPNVEISTHPIDADFSRSSMVLYRGSSAVLYAIRHGLKPIYLHQEGIPDVDPLFELNQWCERVSSAQGVEQALARYSCLGEETAREEWTAAFEYVNAYSKPVDALSIEEFLKAIQCAV